MRERWAHLLLLRVVLLCRQVVRCPLRLVIASLLIGPSGSSVGIGLLLGSLLLLWRLLLLGSWLMMLLLMLLGVMRSVLVVRRVSSLSVRKGCLRRS